MATDATSENLVLMGGCPARGDLGGRCNCHDKIARRPRDAPAYWSVVDDPVGCKILLFGRRCEDAVVGRWCSRFEIGRRGGEAEKKGSRLGEK